MKKLLFLLLLIPAFGFAQLSDATLLSHDSTQIKQLGTSQVRSWQMFKEVIQNKINFGTNALTQNLNLDGAFNVRWGDTTVPLSIFDVVAGNSGYTQFSKALLNINALDLTHIESSSTIAEVLLNSTGVHLTGGISGASPHTNLDLTGTSGSFSGTYGEIQITSGTSTIISLTNTGGAAGTHSGQQISLSLDIDNLSGAGKGLYISDGRPSPAGIEYFATGYVTQLHSLADKEYVDAHGIINTAANNELPKSDGTNIIPSGLFSSTSGNLDLGSTSISGNRTISAKSSSGNNSLFFQTTQSTGIATDALRLLISGTTTVISAPPGRLQFSADVLINRSLIGSASVFDFSNYPTGLSAVAATNTSSPSTVLFPFRVTNTANSGTPSSGFGSGIEFAAQNSANTNKVGSNISTAFSNVTPSSESSDFLISNISAGTLTERLRVTSAGAIGLSGANYGTAGQTIVSGGPGAAVTWGAGGGSGTVSTVSVVSANGLAGTVTNPTTTPAITLSTTLTGLVKGNGTAFSAASAGTDYQAPMPFIDNVALLKNSSDATKLLTLSAASITTGTTRTWTFPDVNGTVARKDGSQTFIGSQTFAGDIVPLTDNTYNIGSTGAFLSGANGVWVSGNYAYVATYTGNALEIIDISTPSSPIHVGKLLNGSGGALLNGPIGVQVVGNYAYVSSNLSNAVEIVDVSIPSNPTHAASIANGAGGASLNGPWNLHVIGNYCYVATTGALEIINISTPTAPTHAGKLTNGTGGALLTLVTGIYVSGNYAYLASYGDNAVEIVDVSNPASPAHAASVTNGTGGSALSLCHGVWVLGNFAYFTARTSGALNIFNISTPTSPTFVSKLTNGTGGASLVGPENLQVIGNYAYITDYTGNAFEIVDISTPASPVHAGKLLDGLGGAALTLANRVYVSGTNAYIASFTSSAIEVVNITTPATPTHLGKILDGANLSNVKTIYTGQVLATGSILIGGTTLIGSESLSIQGNTNATIVSTLVNNTSGTAASGVYRVQNSGSNTMNLGLFSAGYTTSGGFLAGAGYISTDGTALNLLASGGSTPINFYTGGSATGNLRMVLSSSGNLSVGYAAPASVESWGFQKNQNANSMLAVSNTTSGTAGRARLIVSTSATLANGLVLETASAGFTSATISVANTSSIIGSQSGGIQFGTDTGGGQASIWTNGIKRVSVDASGNTSSNATASVVYRNTNGGGDVNAHFLIDPANSLTAGIAYTFDATNGFGFTQGNATRRIQGAAIKPSGLTSTAGSEVMGLDFFTQSGGTAATSKMTLSGAGNLTIGALNNIVGVATNNSATAGNIGEEINAIQSTYTNYTTSATYQNIASITLTAGDWDISGFGSFSTNTSTITAASNAIFVVSTTTASAAGATEGRNIAYIPQAALLGTSIQSTATVNYRVSISGSTTYYLNTQATFTVGNPQFVGSIRARRMR